MLVSVILGFMLYAFIRQSDVCVKHILIYIYICISLLYQ